MVTTHSALTNPLEPMADIATVEATLGVSRSTIARMCDRGEFPRPIRVGRQRRWRIDDIRAWMSRRAQQAR